MKRTNGRRRALAGVEAPALRRRAPRTKATLANGGRLSAALARYNARLAIEVAIEALNRALIYLKPKGSNRG